MLPARGDHSKVTKDAFNDAAASVAEANGFTVIDVYHAFNGPDGTGAAGPLLAADHPTLGGRRADRRPARQGRLAPLR